MPKYAAAVGCVMVLLLAPVLTVPLYSDDLDVIVVDDNGDVGEDVAIALIDDLPAMSYYDRTNGNLKYARCTDETCTAFNITTVDDSPDNVGIDPSLAEIDGLPAITYLDYSNFDLKYARCEDADCTSASTRTIDAGGSVGRFSSLVSLDDLPAVAYYDDTNPNNGNLKYTRCEDITCETRLTVTVDASPSVGMDPSLAVVGGLPAIVYFDDSNDDLKYARCVDFLCRGAQLQTIDGPERVGLQPSMALLDTGLPAMSYFANPRFDMRYAWCGDVNCTTVVSILTVDGDAVGRFSSMAIFDGAPGMVYLDSDDLDVRFSRCFDESCSWGTTFTVDGAGAVGVDAALVKISEAQAGVAYLDILSRDLKFVRFGVPPVPPRLPINDDENAQLEPTPVLVTALDEIDMLPATGQFPWWRVLIVRGGVGLLLSIGAAPIALRLWRALP